MSPVKRDLIGGRHIHQFTGIDLRRLIRKTRGGYRVFKTKIGLSYIGVWNLLLFFQNIYDRLLDLH